MGGESMPKVIRTKLQRDARPLQSSVPGIGNLDNRLSPVVDYMLILRVAFPVPQRLNIFDFSRDHRPLRNGGTMGKFNTPGLPELAGSFIVGWTNASIPTYAHDGCFYASTYQAAQLNQTGTTAVNNTFTLGMKASKANGIFGKSSTVMPSSADIIVGLYLGRLT